MIQPICLSGMHDYAAGTTTSKKIFGTWLYMERYLKKYFVSVLARGMVDPTPVLILDPAKTRFGGTLGPMTQRLRLVIMTILDVFGMD